MTTTTRQPTRSAPRAGRPPRARPGRDVRPLRRVVAALVLVVPASCVAVSRLVAEPFLDGDNRAIMDAIAATPDRAALAIWLGIAAQLTLIPAFLAAARLARRRRPVLAMLGAGVNLAAYLGAGLAFFASDLMLLVGAGLPAGERDAAAGFLAAFTGSPVFSLSIALFVFGHVLGAVLAGLALRGTIPAYGWVALAVSQPLHFVCFVILQNLVLDAMAWGLTAFGLAVCAVVVLRTDDGDWDTALR